MLHSLNIVITLQFILKSQQPSCCFLKEICLSLR